MNIIFILLKYRREPELEKAPMIVCQCEAVTDREIRRIVAEGACTLRQVTRACGAGRQCGGCHPVVEALLVQPAENAIRSQPATALAATG